MRLGQDDGHSLPLAPSLDSVCIGGICCGPPSLRPHNTLSMASAERLHGLGLMYGLSALSLRSIKANRTGVFDS